MCADSVSSRAQEFAARGQVEKNLPHFDAGAGRAARGLDFEDFAAVDDDLRAFGRIWPSRSRVVRVKRLTLAMLGSASPRKPMVAMELRSSARWILLVAWRSRQSRASSRLMPRAVIGDADQAASAGLDFDGDARGLGIEGIFDQFLDDAGGAFDHFAGGDLVGDVFGQAVGCGSSFEAEQDAERVK